MIIVHFIAQIVVEIGYMDGHAPSQEDLDVLEAYYIQLGYHRAEFHLDDVVPYVYEFDLRTYGWPGPQYYSYSSTYRNHSGDPKWQWMLCFHYISIDGKRVEHLGVYCGEYGILIHDQYLKDLWFLFDLTALRRTVMLHEYGHHLNILDIESDGQERYCINHGCAMHEAGWLNVIAFPWYCEHHWSEHRWIS